MAISNYSELQTAVGNWLNRSDLTDRIPEFIALAEAEIKRKLRRKVVKAVLTIDAAEEALPSAAAELRSWRLNTSTAAWNGPRDILSNEALNDYRTMFQSAGRPRYAAVVNQTLLVVPAPDQAYTAEIVYFEALTALSTSNTTNTTLTESPDLYLYGALKHAAPYLEHDERVPTWKGMFDAAIDELNLVREREEFGGAPLPVRLPVVFG